MGSHVTCDPVKEIPCCTDRDLNSSGKPAQKHRASCPEMAGWLTLLPVVITCDICDILVSFWRLSAQADRGEVGDIAEIV